MYYFEYRGSILISGFDVLNKACNFFTRIVKIKIQLRLGSYRKLLSIFFIGTLRVASRLCIKGFRVRFQYGSFGFSDNFFLNKAFVYLPLTIKKSNGVNNNNNPLLQNAVQPHPLNRFQFCYFVKMLILMCKCAFLNRDFEIMPPYSARGFKNTYTAYFGKYCNIRPKGG